MLRKEIDGGKLRRIMKYSKEVERHLLQTKIISSKSCEEEQLCN